MNFFQITKNHKMNINQAIALFALTVVMAIVTNAEESAASDADIGMNGKWPGIHRVGVCNRQENFAICYDCGRNANSVSVYTKCCETDPQTVDLCNGDFYKLAAEKPAVPEVSEAAGDAAAEESVNNEDKA
ncbi:hypothetical protein HELRODRAFT_188570 [Helobdella robusta]|uniref:Secreted protein n=1 Tax=Helobdella robusta TaxID=6412 RepID=T1FQ48_HELRO|nr:hypothetical protein HELRODRAFT_188570 [Helobdella robusta]ESO02082.1 hypothetical protein HELRODRAFT_188570 [Helobdella robusta]